MKIKIASVHDDGAGVKCSLHGTRTNGKRKYISTLSMAVLIPLLVSLPAFPVAQDKASGIPEYVPDTIRNIAP